MRTRILRGLMIPMLTLSFIVGNTLVFAGPLEDARAAYNHGYYATVLRLTRPLAEQGNAEAQETLGGMYLAGNGVAQDSKEAVKWYRLAAAQGYRTASYNLGLMYEQGKGVARNSVLAYMWFDIGVAQGFVFAASPRDSFSKTLTKEQIAKAKAAAKYCQAQNYKHCD
jgi:TPR repeat protein